MGKRFQKSSLWIFLTIVMICLCVKNSVQAEDRENLQNGISLDCARSYCSVADIKGYIDILSDTKNSFLQLYLSDNENVGIECQTLHQTTDTALLLSDGSYQNPSTNKKFLSYGQIADILEYAKENNVSIIPVISLSSRMNGFFELAQIAYGQAYVQKIAVNQSEVPGELNITKPEAQELSKALLEEYSQLFHECSYFHIGADEYWTRWGDRMVNFINGQAEYLMSEGFRVRMWNDLIHKDNIQKFNHDIEIVYWSYDGAPVDEALRAERIKERVTVPELQKEGFRIILTNSYYLYYVPSADKCDEETLTHMVSDINSKWDFHKWDANHEGGLSTFHNIIGAMTAVWKEDAEGVPESLILEQTSNMYHAMVQKVILNQKNWLENPDWISDDTNGTNDTSSEAGQATQNTNSKESPEIQIPEKNAANEEKPDNTKPVITWKGKTKIKTKTGQSIRIPKAVATDNIDGTLTKQIKVSVKKGNKKFTSLAKKIRNNKKVKFTKAGKYTITYTVTDQAGNKAIKKRYITVTKK